MRLVNDNIPTPMEALKKVCTDEGIGDSDLVADVYAICSVHAQNIHFKEVSTVLSAFEQHDPTFWAGRQALGARIVYLDTLASTNYVQSLVALDDPMKASLMFIDCLAKTKAAKQLQACESKPFDFDIGEDMDTLDISMTEDHEEALVEAIHQLSAMEDILGDNISDVDICEDESLSEFVMGGGTADAEYGRVSTVALGALRNQFTQGYSSGKALSDQIIHKGFEIPKRCPEFFKIFKAACESVGSGTSQEVTSDFGDVKNRKQMEDLSELESIDPVDLSMDTFDIKASRKELSVQRHIEEKEGKSHLFVLLDVSMSMQSTGAGGINRCISANAISLALLKYALDDKYQVWLVPFAEDVDRRNVQHAKDKTSALNAMKWLGSLTYNGGGTSIESALMYAYEQVKEDKQYKKCEIVLITDGECTVGDCVITKKPHDTTVRTIFLQNVAVNKASKAMTNLTTISESMTVLRWDKKGDCFDFGDAFKGLSQWK